MNDPIEEAFRFVAPRELRQSVERVFFTWVQLQPVLPPNYKEVARDFYYLIQLLDKEETSFSEPQKQPL